jgi:LasA protease
MRIRLKAQGSRLKAKLGPLTFGVLFFLSACASPAPTPAAVPTLPPPTATVVLETDATPLPTRTTFEAGTRLPYTAQSGDTVAALAAHFNTSVDEILAANPHLPLTTTLPVGLPFEIPAYYFALGGPAFKIVSDGALVYGPDSVGFDVAAYLDSHPGFMRTLSAFMAGKQRDAAGAIEYVAEQYSLNPKLLLALMEWRTHALTQGDAPQEVMDNPLGPLPEASGFSAQLRWAAEQLSIGYYGWRSGTLTEIPLQEGYTSRVDSYQNAGTVGVQYLLAHMLAPNEFENAAGPEGFAAAYRALWGDPFAKSADVIPGHLTQPELTLPFAPNQLWSFTGGPHPGWGEWLPWSALDFAPPAGETGCITTDKWTTAAAAGVIARSGDNTVILDLDGDGLEQTGWVLFYFHIAENGIITAGTRVKAGDPLGHPSCEGGHATGTHVHLVRKYNGEWLPADGVVPEVVPFVLGGWTTVRGDAPYAGRMTRLGAWVEACTCSTASNRVYWAP